MKAFAAFVTVWTRTLSAGEKRGLGCAAVEAVIEAGLVTEADVRQAHAAIGIGAVIFGTAE